MNTIKKINWANPKGRPKVNPEKNWPGVERMLYSMAWKTTERYGVPFEDCRSEVYYAFMKACWRFDPTRDAKFSSFCCFIANCRLKSLIMNRAADNKEMPCVELNEDVIGYAPEQRSECMEMIEDLSEDAKEIVALLLEIPKDLVGKRMSPRQLLRRVKQHLIEECGKDRDAINTAHKELCRRFRSVWV